MNLINKSYNLFFKYFVLIFIKIFLILAFLKTHSIYGTEFFLIEQKVINLDKQVLEQQKKEISTSENVYIFFKEKILDVSDNNLKSLIEKTFNEIIFDPQSNDAEIISILRKNSNELVESLIQFSSDMRNKIIEKFFLDFLLSLL
ncbi:hypothetical protein [Candidatus Phytoplasma oryzae]|nr:hypothetical protein PIE28_02055 [Candidatus Phytoplasma oryzae]